jgi:hypothetical protein
MTILVSDTSVLIDLERGGFLDSCFRLPFAFAVPDLLYARELAAFGGPELVARGLRVEELVSHEVVIAQNVRVAHPKLSLPDAFAYALASVRGWTLLTGDGELRALAQDQQVPFFGVLWVLDQLFDGQVIEAAVIVAGLEAIAAHPRCRLPRAEIQVRLERYGKSKK